MNIEVKSDSAWVDATGKDLTEMFDHFVGQLGLEIRWRVARRTPVLTGRARGNWNLSFDRPNFSTDVEFFDPSGELGDAKARAIAENAKAGDAIYVTNALPYIWAIDHGHSRKTAPAYIELTQAEVPFIAQQVANGMGDRLHGRANIYGSIAGDEDMP